MMLVDSSVWIDFLHGTRTPQSDFLGQRFGTEPIAIGDLILAEVLQGIADERQFQWTRARLSAFPVVTIGGASIALASAQNYRALRRVGITVRKTIDTLIATRCILDGYALLYSDRDFDPFVTHLGLQPALALS